MLRSHPSSCHTSTRLQDTTASSMIASELQCSYFPEKISSREGNSAKISMWAAGYQLGYHGRGAADARGVIAPLERQLRQVPAVDTALQVSHLRTVVRTIVLQSWSPCGATVLVGCCPAMSSQVVAKPQATLLGSDCTDVMCAQAVGSKHHVVAAKWQ